MDIWGFEENPPTRQTVEEPEILNQTLSATAEDAERTTAETGFRNEALSTLFDEVEVESIPSKSFSDQDSTEITYDVPIVNNKYVKKYITLFQTRLRPNFEKWLSRSGRYLQMIRLTLRENHLPEDLVYLALIESGFNPRAHSRSKATGVWQFMKGTGKRYGLRIDRWVDERRDPVKSTEAAARYLTELYEMFGSWPLALAGYNAGEGRIYKTIVRVRTRDYWKLRKSRHLRPETRNYVPKFMAATIIAKNPEKYQFFVDYEEPLQYDEVKIKNATYLSAIARHAQISVKELKQYNPELKRGVTPPQVPGYLIKLPPGKKEIFLASYSAEKEEQIFVGRSFKHRVRKGETISSIAQQYGVRVNLLLKANRLNSRSIIRVGQHVLINESPSRIGGRHLIRKGESISTIGAIYHISVRKLLEANQLNKNSVIRAGHSLIIPAAAPKTRRAKPLKHVTRGDLKKHRIQTGESISTIARKYAVRMRDLLEVNRLKKNSMIRAGRTLIIP